MPQSNLVNAEILIGVKEAAAELSLDIAVRMEKVGLSPKLLLKPDGFISWPLFNDLLEMVAKEDHCHQVGLLIGKHQPAMQLGMLGQMMKLCPNVRTALEKGQQYNTVYSHTVYWEVSISSGFVYVSRKLRQAQRGIYGQSNSLGVAQVFKLLQVLCGTDWRPTSISFIHAEPDAPTRKEYHRFFKVPVSFNQENDSIIFPEEDLQRPIASADSHLLGLIESHAEALQKEFNIDNDLATKVRLLIRQQLNTSGCSINHVAQILQVHPKALHRQLKKRGYIFKQLLNEERHELAQYYLSKSNIRLMQLAEMLGYSDASALSRAFKNQCGLSPCDWKMLHGEQC